MNECEHINAVYPVGMDDKIIRDNSPVKYWKCVDCGMISGDLEDFA